MKALCWSCNFMQLLVSLAHRKLKKFLRTKIKKEIFLATCVSACCMNSLSSFNTCTEMRTDFIKFNRKFQSAHYAKRCGRFSLNFLVFLWTQLEISFFSERETFYCNGINLVDFMCKLLQRGILTEMQNKIHRIAFLIKRFIKASSSRRSFAQSFNWSNASLSLPSFPPPKG